MKKIVSLIIVVSVLLIAANNIVIAAGNSTENMYEEGVKYFEKEDYDHAFSYFQISGEVKGYAPSLNMLGVCYRDGLGTEQNIGEAERYFRLSADQGYAPAQENLTALEEARKEEVKGEKEHVDIASVSVGDYIIFGSYEQDNDLTNGREPIEWLVLDVQDGEALLLSRFALASKPFEESRNNAAWETSSLRAWLNGEFYNTSFSADEKASIIDDEVLADKNPKYGTSSGSNTRDRVFLLSISEAEGYFNSAAERVCRLTEAGKENTRNDNNCWWWLRTAGNSAANAGVVNVQGAILNSGDSIRKNGGVRPLIRVEISRSQPQKGLNDKTSSLNDEEPDATVLPDVLSGDIGVSVGDYITFGTYEQDNNMNNGKEPIEWLVLDIMDGKAMVISKYLLDSQPFNDSDVHTIPSWEECSLRQWLNESFLNLAFDNTEQDSIRINDATQDRVFLLSMIEAWNYLPSNAERMCTSTAYCYAQESYQGLKDYWWLRDTASAHFMDGVSPDGRICDLQEAAYWIKFGVRPVLWINLEQ